MFGRKGGIEKADAIVAALKGGLYQLIGDRRTNREGNANLID
ncbi:hypothetical protein [Xenorhabdus eapokensis]|uniref:Uncharacterized protein n=1 Tax=Xenorhabdus eapokensis TaxID=1873482 RepID=A0A1Q5TR77_9GAMM|nr:hypothetical protein [Xenorhabdus eapokensis]OKP02736.1 hypothetical protein Xedl_02146 [Xenorhabdus eapokensis]